MALPAKPKAMGVADGVEEQAAAPVQYSAVQCSRKCASRQADGQT